MSKDDSKDAGTSQVKVSKQIDGARANRVFAAWLDPAIARRFLFATPEGEMVKVEIDARVGGGFEVIERRRGEDWSHVGTYVELDAPRRLAFDLRVPKAGPDTSRIAIDVEPAGDGAAITLTHDGVPKDAVERDRKGWQTVLDSLSRALAKP